MSQASGHLSEAQVKACITGSAMDPDAQKQLDAHLVDCESCLNRLLDAERIHLGLLEGDGMTRTPYPGCPAEETLQELAAGICAPDTAETATEHAAHCNYCGPLLSQYLREFSDDVQAEDAALLQELKTSSPKWQKNFIRENLPKPVPVPWFRGWWPKLATAGATAAAVVAGLFFYLRPSDLEKAQQSVAYAYGQRRTTEMRLPSSPHAPFEPSPVERGGDSSMDWTSKPEALLRAEEILNKQRRAGDLNAQWLEVEGRIDLLEAQPAHTANAVEAFEQSLGRDPSNVSLRVDLAAAYFEVAIRTAPDHPVLLKTIDLLNQALKDPRADKQQKASALFDLAIAYQRSNMRDLAAATWERYLQVDPSGPWSDEARSRLKKLKEDAPNPKLQSYVNSKDPSFFLANSSNPVAQHDIEEYQEAALTSWLPQVSDGEPWRAAQELADILKQQHSDSWLGDFINANGGAESVRVLGAAILDNQKGLYGQALRESRTATATFHQQRNTPGELRSRFEEVYALRSMLQGDACLIRAGPLRRELSKTNYPWLQAQVLLEQAQCRNFLSKQAEAARDSTSSLTIASNFHFPILVLRVMGIDAGMKHQQKRCTETWKESVDGLSFYWQGNYPPARLDQFYAVLWQCALDSGNSYAAEALLRHTLEMRESPTSDVPKNEIREATLELHLKNILTEHGETALAEDERRKALLKLQNVPESYAENFRLTTEFDPAERELRHQDAQLALVRLKPIEQVLKATQDSYFSLRFYNLLGNIYLHLGQFEQATAAYGSAIQMAEVALGDAASDKDRVGTMHATGESYRGMVRVLLEENRLHDALVRWEWYKERPFLYSWGESRIPPSGMNSWVSAQRGSAELALPSSTETRLVYASFEDGLQIWVYRNGRVHGRWVSIGQTNLRQAINDFTKQCSSPNSDIKILQDEGEKLYSLLIQPVGSQLPERETLVAELDPPSIELALGALKTPSGHYVEERYSFVYSPGLLMEKNLRGLQPIEMHEPLLFIDASHSRDNAGLPGASLERQTVSDLFSKVTVVDSENASWASLRPKVASSEVLVFVGHGRADGTGAALVLNSRESLSARDFSHELLSHAKLAVLSACSTGTGADDGLLDTDNLVYSFLSAGVPSVIASRWNVDSEATARLMRNFYMNLKRGMTVALAIAQARRDILHDMPHPYYWAAFNVAGRAS